MDMFKVITVAIQSYIWYKGFRLYYTHIDWKSPVYGQDKKYMYCYSQKVQIDAYYVRQDRIFNKLAYAIYS
jgi:hypothetical protein